MEEASSLAGEIGFFVLRTKIDGVDEVSKSNPATHFLLYFKSTEQALGENAKPTGVVPIVKGSTKVTNVTKKKKDCLQIETPDYDRKFFVIPETGTKKLKEILTNLEPPEDANRLRAESLGQRPGKVTEAAIASSLDEHGDGGDDGIDEECGCD